MSDQTQITEQTASPVETTPTPTETNTTQATISSTTQPQPTVNKTWKEAISEEFRNDPNIEKFTEIDALAKSYINATRMIGQDKVDYFEEVNSLIEDLILVSKNGNNQEIVSLMKRIVPEFKSMNSVFETLDV